jgi:hypothetical protein
MENNQIKKQTAVKFTFTLDKLCFSRQLIQLLGGKKRINGNI